MDKILSIVIPSYNMEAYLPKCLGSLLDDETLRAQLDVIVVNDGSKDRTGEIAHDFERRYPGVVRVIDKPNGHYGSAVNAGLEASVGLYVKNLDADDTFDAAGLAALLAQIESDSRAGKSADLYLTPFDHVDERGKTTRVVSHDLPDDRVFGLEEILAKTTAISMHACTWRVGLMKEIGYRQTEGIAYSDWEWILYPMLKVRTIRYLPTRVYRYLYGREGQSVSQAERCRNAGAWTVLLDRCSDVFRTHGAKLSPPAREYLFRVMIGMANMSAETAFVLGPIGVLDGEITRLFAALESMQRGFGVRLEDEARILKGSLNVPYLRVWRKLPFGKTAWVLLVRSYLVVVQWLR